jgi:hypothetical protein
MKGSSMGTYPVMFTVTNESVAMSAAEYKNRLEDLYKLAVKVKNVGQALEILEKINHLK